MDATIDRSLTRDDAFAVLMKCVVLIHGRSWQMS